jgi:type 1 glutamine amidotransferase
MNRFFTLLLISFFFVLTFAVTANSTVGKNEKLINVLIFSGKNNHEWQKTTPLLSRILKETKLFNVSITEKPETISYTDLKNYDLVISNWNTWPDNNLRLSSQWENDFVRYVKEGGGMLTLHAGGSSFYGFDDYHQISIGRWGKETSHGPATVGKVYGFDQNHPITKGMGTFYIMDEIWERTDIFPGSTELGSLSAKDKKDGRQINVKSVYISQTGKGRTFYTTLGHDERALLNSGLQKLLLRAAQWCAGREVTIKIPYELQTEKNQIKEKFGWSKTDSSLTLFNNSEIVWQYNFNNRFGKPYFHPLAVDHSDLTCVSPPDHPWHLGLWYSWKFINGINYWEYLSDYKSPESGYRSEGITEILKKEVKTNPDFSADIGMEISYHPVNGKAVLTENRKLYVSPQLSDGSYFIDEEHLFTAKSEIVELDRTPIIGEPGGQSWGGYAGLSVRFNQDFTAPEILTETDSANCPKCNWLYMGFNNLTGRKTGMAILQNPQLTPKSSSWYLINDQKIPFYYYSPAVLFDSKIVLKKGEALRLEYRIWLLPGEITKEKLKEKFDSYLNK